jgi:PAS domain S-box-containing protein
MTDESGDPAATWSGGQLRALLDSAPDALVIVDRDGRIVLFNAQAERLFGYARADILWAPVDMLLPQRYRSSHLHSRERFSKDPQTRPMGSGLLLFGLRQDGTEFPLDISLSVLETPEGLLVTAAIRDISYAEQRIQLALRAARMGVWDFEFATGRVRWSPTMATVFGLEHAHAPTRFDELMALIHPDDRPGLQESVGKAVQGEDYEMEFRTTPPGGEEIWIAGRARVLYNATGAPEHMLGVGMDITARKHLEAKLAAETIERVNAQTSIAEQRLRVLKATMRSVHDIVNNALNGIAAFRFEAESTLSTESLAQLDEMVADTAERLRLLSALESTPELTMDSGVGIDYRTSGPRRDT